jgi:hypothetical protein
MCRDIELLNVGQLTSEKADHIFFKIKPAAQPTVNFVQFMEGLRYVAMITRMSLNEVVHRIVAIAGPIETLHR